MQPVATDVTLTLSCRAEERVFDEPLRVGLLVHALGLSRLACGNAAWMFHARATIRVTCNGSSGSSRLTLVPPV
jgi:hypothetical protein